MSGARRAFGRPGGALRTLVLLGGAAALPCTATPGTGAGAEAVDAATAGRCALQLVEHRSGRPLQRLPLAATRPEAQIAFTHSVLGTPVVDRYVWRRDGGRWRAHLVEEFFVGDGYGLPHAAGPGERLQRAGEGWRLLLDRVVDPLVVLPLPEQQMRLKTRGQAPQLLGELSRASVAITFDCR